jgi:type VI protein secretion system component VasK
MSTLRRLLLSRLFIGSWGWIALSVLVWWVGPLIDLGGSRPLADPWIRLVVLGLLWLVWISRLA